MRRTSQDAGPCVQGYAVHCDEAADCAPGAKCCLGPGQAVAAAFTKDDRLLVFSRERAKIFVRQGTPAEPAWAEIDLGGPSREDTGHAIFHSDSGGGIACASCHPEGGDDGHVWFFSDVGARRTQSLRGTLEGTAPYHWDGALADLDILTKAAYETRMGGQALMPDQTAALRAWMIKIPTLPVTAADPAAVRRGKALFENGVTQCSTCHADAKLTNNATVAVGTTGGRFQVPSLVGLAARAPYLHDGRSETLLDVLGRDNFRDAHGRTSHLTTAQRKDLATYLESL